MNGQMPLRFNLRVADVLLMYFVLNPDEEITVADVTSKLDGIAHAHQVRRAVRRLVKDGVLQVRNGQRPPRHFTGRAPHIISLTPGAAELVRSPLSPLAAKTFGS